ncbi:MAG: preprotein translocase subunit SecA [Desulfuromonadales bacterium]|nr:preprotein translocase subunit SecA [Desulfuromonadales bacterium]
MTVVSNLYVPPATHDVRAEQPDRVENKLEVFAHRLFGQLRKIFSGRGRLRRLVARIEAAEPRLQALDNQQLQQEIQQLRQQLHIDGMIDELLVCSFALVRELSVRTLGMRPYASQLTGGLVLLQGMVAEMDTGEGKTLTATLPAATVALAGIPVHVISVNDYLTARDTETMLPLYQALGLQVGCVVHGQTPGERRRAYQCDVTYATNKELVFDYLRDRLTLGDRLDPLLLQAEYLHGESQRSKRVLLRGLHFAIVDEADSILIDEARTPLIISGADGGDEERQFLQQALDLAAELIKGEDYVLDSARRQLRLTDVGKQKIAAAVSQLGPLWSGLVRRESTVHQALTAIQFFHRDEQYLLRDGKVQIIDEFTGRVMEDRSWEQGLHQLIELKEGCELTQRRETLAKISYQRFFRRYRQLSGMTGTAKEVAAELWAVYHLPTLKVPTHRPIIRKILPDRVLATQQQKWQAVVAEICRLHHLGRPLLVGTRSVAASEHLSALVRQAGLEHQVLNAKQDADEADIVSAAGIAASITIATNMAGRGTDIVLGEGVRQIGGLHVIATERHEAARIDRQLAGRCGRQGDPGSYQAILSLEDPLLDGTRGGLIAQLLKGMDFSNLGVMQPLARRAISQAQVSVEKYHARIRRELFRQDQQQGNLLSFSGKLE